MNAQDILDTYNTVKAGNYSFGKNDDPGVITKSFMEIYGRPPTVDEYNQAIAPTHQGQLLSYLSGLHQQEQNTPDKLYAKQQAEWQAGASQHYDQVGSIFKNLLGRDPTQDELQHYGTLLSSGQADPYQLSQFVQSLPEYQNAADTKFRSGLNDELQGYDQKFFNNAKEDVISRYAQMGRSTSPALDVALTDLQAQINEKRGNFLAQAGVSQYGGNKDSALADYKSTMTGVNSRYDTGANADYNNYVANMKRQQNLDDYSTQKSDWFNAQNQFGSQKPGVLDYLNAGTRAIPAITSGASLFL